MQKWLAAASVACVVALMEGTVASADGKKIDEIIAQLKKNEALYKKIDVSLSESYDIGGRNETVDPKGGVALRSYKKEIRSVVFDGKYRVDTKKTSTLANGKKITETAQAIFDGESTYSRHGDSESRNVGSQDYSDLVRPHEFLMTGRIWLRAPLSVYLSGQAALKSYPGTTLDESAVLSVKYMGLKKHKKRNYQVVRIIYKSPTVKGPLAIEAVDELWLDPKRNYLAVRIIGYMYRWSKTIPISESEVKKFKEIRPGLWFPMVAEIKRWQSMAVKTQQQKLLQWRKVFVVESVRFNPKVDAKFFAIPN